MDQRTEISTNTIPERIKNELEFLDFPKPLKMNYGQFSSSGEKDKKAYAVEVILVQEKEENDEWQEISKKTFSDQDLDEAERLLEKFYGPDWEKIKTAQARIEAIKVHARVELSRLNTENK